jgi:5'-methylthioadenosine phosphorylase
MTTKIGVIGGSGLYEIDAFENIHEERIETPFGDPSDVYICGTINGIETVFLPRHGRGHRILPSELNFKANIYGMKALGVSRVLSVSAVGSLREEMAPRDIVMIDQFFDRTKRSADHTFFGNGIVGHVGFSDPICPELIKIMHDVTAEHLRHEEDGPAGRPPKAHLGGTYVNMEGPAFSTRAESNTYRKWGMDIIGMTNLAEAKLCREAEMCFCTMALVTDYDCWHETHGAVNVEMVIDTLQKNSRVAKAIVKDLIPQIAGPVKCDCATALQNAVMTDPAVFPAKTRADLDFILDKYYPRK